MNENEDRESASANADMEKVFRIIGRRAQLPVESKERWAGVFRAELAMVVARRRRRRRMAAAGSLVGLLLLALLYGELMIPEITETPVVAHLMGSVGEVVTEAGPVISAKATITIRAGETVTTGMGSYARIGYQNADVRLDEKTTIQVLQDQLVLQNGRLYVATPGTRESSIRISAGTAEIGDIGTQFLVATSGHGVVTQVREGTIVVTVPGGEYQVRADETAGRLEWSRGGAVQISRVERRGEHWDWILHLTPEFVIEGRTALEFLEWSSAETGRQLLFADHRAERIARTTILHGDLSGVTPDRGVDIVLATTRLTARRPNPDQLEIALRNGSGYGDQR